MKAHQPGSIVSPEQLAKLQKKQPPVPPTEEQKPVEAAATPDDEAAKKAAEFKEAKAKNEETIGVTISDADISEYIFRGRIVKKDVVAIKNRLKVTFQTLTPTEIDAVDEYVAGLRESDSLKRTHEGINNLKTIRQLCYAWLEINGKPLPKDIDAKSKAIQQMGTVVVNRVVEAFRVFDFLVEMTLREDEFLKK